MGSTKTTTARDTQTQTPAQVTLVKQQELITLIGLKNQIQKLTEQKDLIETELKNLLIAGVPVEEGVHIAKAEYAERRNVAWREEFEALADKLKGAGAGAKLAEKILNDTEPSKFVKLTVK